MEGSTAQAAKEGYTAPGGAITRLRAVLAHAQAAPRLAERLGRAEVVVALSVVDAGATWTLVLQGGRVELRDGEESGADIALRIGSEALLRTLDDDVPLAMQIADGAASYEGPVRRLLRVEPILRAEAQRLAGADDRLAA